MTVHCHHHLCSHMLIWCLWSLETKYSVLFFWKPSKVKLELHCQQLHPHENLRPPFGRQVCVHANIESRLQEYRETMS